MKRGREAGDSPEGRRAGPAPGGTADWDGVDPAPPTVIEAGGKTCSHEVAWPPGAVGGSGAPPGARPGPPAKQFPFALDPFQRTAINCLEAGKRPRARSYSSFTTQHSCNNSLQLLWGTSAANAQR